MVFLSFHCPKTGDPIKTNVDSTARNLPKYRDTTIHVRCVCGEIHVVQLSKTFVDEPAPNNTSPSVSDEEIQALAERMVGNGGIEPT